MLEKTYFRGDDNGPIPTAEGFEQESEVLCAGCYLLRWKNEDGTQLTGSFRVSLHAGRYRASGDLYSINDPEVVPDAFPAFPREQCRFYFAVRSATTTGTFEQIDLLIERARFSFPMMPHAGLRTWTRCAEQLSVNLVRKDAPGNGSPRYSGTVRPTNAALIAGNGTVACGANATLSLEWRTEWLREAAIDIVMEQDVQIVDTIHLPGLLTKIGEQIGWKLAAGTTTVVNPPSTGYWEDNDLFAGMQRWRMTVPYDDSFRYAAFLIGQLSGNWYGYMFDTEAIEGDLLPREAFAVACARVLGHGSAFHGDAKDKPLGQVERALVHVIAHEFGHVLGAPHDSEGTYFMRTTDSVISDPSNATRKFPDNTATCFVDSDIHFFQHAPDWFVRSGGERFVHGSSHDGSCCEAGTPIAPPVSVFSLEPVATCFPLGAPVRLNLVVVNQHPTYDLVLPAKLSLSLGNVHGWVTDEYKNRRGFAPLQHCPDGGLSRKKVVVRSHGGKAVVGSVTLLRGGDGALFPRPGDYAVEIVASWSSCGGCYRMTATTSITVEAPRDAKHRTVAESLIRDPDAFLVLLMGAVDTKPGIKAIRRALRCQPLLKHYAWIEAKRLYQARSRLNDPALQTKLIKRYRGLIATQDLVLTVDELQKRNAFAKTLGEE